MDHPEELKYILLLERIGQPLCYGPKGHGSTKFLYNLPLDEMEPYEAEAMAELRQLIPTSTTLVEVEVDKTAVPYDLTSIKQAVPKDGIFGEMHGAHLDAADELVKILKSQSTKAEFFNASALCRDSVNPQLWVYAFTKAILQRPDMRGIRLPAVWEVMPDMFIEGKVWKEAIKQATLPDKQRAIMVVDKNFTGTNLNYEHKVSYWREDLGANSHHWHWHLFNPFNAPKGTVDRKGELLYYMHHSMLARYDAERLSNGLNRVVPFNLFQDIVEEACFGKLALQNSGRDFAGRPENSVLRDFDRSRDVATARFSTMSDIRAWYGRVAEAIDAGFAIKESGGRIDLRTDEGINVVTSMWESSFDSPHRNYYGNMHNLGHSAFSLLHDPDFRYKEPPGIMFLTGTSLRDPTFYRWHKLLDNLSQRLKDYLVPYTQENLQFNGIVVNEIHMVRRENNHFLVTLNPINNLITHWMQSDIEISRGLDFGRTNINGLGSIWVRTTHLQHLPFHYRIRVTNQNGHNVHATFRIFIAPSQNENGESYPFYEQRLLFIELDKFTKILHPGENLIIQKSEDSTMTVPWAQTFREIERDVAILTRAQAICSCGWPDHLLLPKGTVGGMPFDLFVMLTDTEIDQVKSSKRQLGTLTAKGTCRDSISYCGVLDDKFPDSRPMGYPFDRPAILSEKAKPNLTLKDFLTVSNMATTEVKIYHIDKTILRGNGAPEHLRQVRCTP